MVAAMTLCGTISPAPLGSHLDRRLLEELRERTDGSLIGAGTLRDCNPELRGLDGRFIEGRLRAIVSASGTVPVEGRDIFSRGPRPTIFTGSDVVQSVCRTVKGRAEVCGLKRTTSGLCLTDLFAFLRQKGIESLLIEGGGQFNYSCLQQLLVDELYLTIVPLLSGDRSAARLVNGDTALGVAAGRVQLLDCRQQKTGELFLHYRLRRPAVGS